MILCRRFILVILVLCSVAMLSAPHHVRAEGFKQVVTSVTTDDVNRAAMAIQFTRSIMQEKNCAGVLFFNVYGVNLVNAKIASPTYDSGESIAAMLADFMKAGGQVFACPMCMKHVGKMTNADLLQGVAAVKGAGVKAVSAPDTLVLSY
jgi:intracellular sulfur oxidation DsrE/DsrF family protein